mgnify:CR=1 FL=1
MLIKVINADDFCSYEENLKRKKSASVLYNYLQLREINVLFVIGLDVMRGNNKNISSTTKRMEISISSFESKFVFTVHDEKKKSYHISQTYMTSCKIHVKSCKCTE